MDERILKLHETTEIYADSNLYHHLVRVLRIKVKDSFIVGDKNETEFTGIINLINKEKIIVNIDNYHYRENIKNPELTLFFTLLKNDNNELIIEKCTEIGVDRFIPVITKNCIIKPDQKSIEKKIDKWKNLIRESSSQCGRRKIPEIFPITLFEDLKKYDNMLYKEETGNQIDHNLKLLCHLDKNSKMIASVLKEYEGYDKISVFIGPEGDFTEKELEILKKKGFIPVKLGENVLRSETAAIYGSSVILSNFGRGYLNG